MTVLLLFELGFAKIRMMGRGFAPAPGELLGARVSIHSSGEVPEWLRGQTVNLLAPAYGGSNPSLTNSLRLFPCSREVFPAGFK